uniref:Uncharacterized protein n=1 Tax=Anguilla anguilla TaxID=7936 RepID=A0A0E9QJS9_ANGAN
MARVVVCLMSECSCLLPNWFH